MPAHPKVANLHHKAMPWHHSEPQLTLDLVSAVAHLSRERTAEWWCVACINNFAVYRSLSDHTCEKLSPLSGQDRGDSLLRFLWCTQPCQVTSPPR